MASGGPCNLVKVGTLRLENADRRPEYKGLVVSGDVLMVTDWKACNVRLHRRLDGKLLATTDQFESWPCGMCLINDMGSCVSLFDNQIEILSVQCTGDSGVITRVRTLHVNTGFNRCLGVVKCRDKVVVCGSKQNNTICWCTVSLNDRHVDTVTPICKGGLLSQCHLTTKHNMIYISCYAFESPETGVYGFDIENPSKPKRIYKHEELVLPQGITVDSKGFIFVCNFDPPCIHHLTDKCELVTIYREGMAPSLHAIFWDQQYGLLYVTCYGRKRSNVITRYKPVYQEGMNMLLISCCPEAAATKMGHVMISYDWNQQPKALWIKGQLEVNGYTAWMDIEHMRREIFQSMAEAVEKAHVVLVCMSQRYKESNNCKREATYTAEKEKIIIPLKMEQDFISDGWLGILVSGFKYYDFSGKYPLEEKMRELLTELSRCYGKAFGEPIIAPFLSRDQTKNSTAASGSGSK